MADQISHRMEVLAVSDGSMNVGGTPVKLVIGSEEKVLFAHDVVIRAHSGFFEAALSKKWKEGRERDIKLPEDDIDEVNLYIQWLYSSKIHTQLDASSGIFSLLAKLYILVEKFIDTEFQNCVVDATIAANRKPASDGKRYCPDPISVKIIYDNTCKGSPARSMMVDFFVSKGEAGWISEYANPLETFSSEFLVDLSTALLKDRVVLHKDKKKYDHLDSGVPCVYHIHEKHVKCEEEQD